LRDFDGFNLAVKNVIDHVSFDVNTKPQVFEITIRALGGLLSAHIFAEDKQGQYHLPWYQGELLRLAFDLGERLLPAFRTSTGIPYARVRSIFKLVSDAC
jgi:mannosidase alpha-like ER degradation enhancer 1